MQSIRSNRGQRLLAGVLSLALAAGLAQGQTLNLDAPVAPPPGSGERSEVLIDAAADQILALTKERDSGSADASIELRIAVRTLAQNLLKAGESKGEEGSGLIVAGQTILLRVAGLDRRIRGVMDEMPAEVIAELKRRWTLPPEKLPVDAEALWRFLRDSFAPLVKESDLGERLDRVMQANLPESRVIAPLMKIDGTLADYAATNGLDASVVEACRVIDLRMQLGKAWPAYVITLETLRANAVDALWLLTAPPDAGIPRAMRSDLSLRFAEAVQTVAKPAEGEGIPRNDDSAAVGGRSLRILATASRSIELCTRIEPKKSAQSVADSLVRMLAGRGSIATQQGEIARDVALVDRLGRIERLLRSMAGVNVRGELVMIDEVLRQLRPAIKPLEEARRQAAGDLLEACSRAVHSPDVVSDPGFLQSATLYRQRLDDLSRAMRVTKLLGHTPKRADGTQGNQVLIRDEYERLGDRLLLLARGLSSPRENADAIIEWRAYTSAIEYLPQGDEEKFLRDVVGKKIEDPAGTVARVTGGRAGDLVARLDEAREAWIEQVKRARQIAAPALVTAASDMRASLDAVKLAWAWSTWLSSLAPGADPMVASSDAGSALASWELSAFASRVLIEADLDGVAAGLVLAADGKRAEFAARGWEQVSMRVRGLAGQIAGRAHLRGARALSDDGVDLLRQIAIGLPDHDRVASASVRAELLSMSRYLEELALAMDTGEAQTRVMLENYLTTRRQAVEAAIEAWGN